MTLRLDLALPAVLGIQAGRQAPRYVPVSRVRQVMREASIEEIEAEVPDRVEISISRLRLPEATTQAEILSGSLDGIADQIIALLRARNLLGGEGGRMSTRVLVLAEHLEGTVTDVTYELLGLARRLAQADGLSIKALVLGRDGSAVAERLPADRVIVVEHPALAYLAPEPAARTLVNLVADDPPRFLLIPNTSIGMDIAAWVSTRLGWPMVAYCRSVERDNGKWIATAQLFGGKILAEVPLSTTPVVLNVLAGSFSGEAVEPGPPSTIVPTPPPPELEQSQTQVVELERPEAADVDITRAEKIVAVGRGIESKDNLELAEQLANALGAALAASRPLVDAGWLPRSRQVGKSGLKVKPKLYLALGISGAPEHLEGMKDAELIIAVNKDPKAPIFTVADYGVTGDLFEIAEALLERLEG